MEDRTQASLRRLYEGLGYSPEAVAAMLGVPGPAGRSADARLSEALGALGVPQPDPANVGSTPGTGLLAALVEEFRANGAAEADAHRFARRHVLAVANRYPGRADLAEAELWRQVGQERLGRVQEAHRPATAPAAPADPRPRPAPRRLPPIPAPMPSASTVESRPRRTEIRETTHAALRRY